MKRLQIVGVAIVIVGIIFLVYRPIRDSMRGYFEVMTYPVGTMDDGKKIPLNRTIYRVYPKEGRAIYWLPGVIESPENLVNCVVRDRCNWTCSYPDFSSDVRIGNCMEESYDPDYSKPVSAIEWWRLHYD